MSDLFSYLDTERNERYETVVLNDSDDGLVQLPVLGQERVFLTLQHHITLKSSSSSSSVGNISIVGQQE